MKLKDCFSDLLQVRSSSSMLFVTLVVGMIHWDMKLARGGNLCVPCYRDYPSLPQFFID